MKKTILKSGLYLIIFYLLPIPFLKSQNLSWGNWATQIKKTRQGSGFVNMSSFDIDSKGDMYVACSYRMNDFIFGKDTFKYDGTVVEPRVITKISSTGEVLWAKLLNSGWSNALIKIDRNDVIHYFSNSSFGTSRLIGPYYAQFSSSGSLLREIEMLKADSANMPGTTGVSVKDLMTDENNNYYTLFTYSTDRGIINFQDGSSLNTTAESLTFPYLILQKFNAQNKLVWKKVMRMKDEVASGKIAIDKNQNVILSGTFQKQIIVDDKQLNIPDDFTSDIYVIKFDNTGLLKWQKSFGAAGSEDFSNSVTTDKNNNIYIVGTLGNGNYSFDTKTVNVLVNDPFALQLDENGVTSRVINIPINTELSAGRDIQVDSLGNIIMMGEYRGAGKIGTTTLPTVNYLFGLSFFISAIDKDNNIKSTLTTAGSNEVLNIRRGKILLKGSKVYMTGNFTNYIQFGNLQLKEPSNCSNCYDGFISSMNYSITSGIKDKLINSSYLDFYPNPSSGSLFIKSSLPILESNIEISVFDVLGRLVQKTQSSTIDLNQINLKEGVYSIFWQSEHFKGSKMVVVKSN